MKNLTEDLFCFILDQVSQKKLTIRFEKNLNAFEKKMLSLEA